MPKRKRSSDYCNADAKWKKERIAAESLDLSMVLDESLSQSLV